MLYKKLDPMYMDLINITPGKLSLIGEVKVTDIFIPLTKNFHPDGLFSTDIFGVQGSPDRMKNYGYIDLHTDLIHPLVYGMLVKARALYGEILAGRKYAVFNKKTKMFEEVDIDLGQTGYSFFMEHIHEVEVEDTGSVTRRKLIKMLEKYRKRLTIRNFIVLPAGLRDYRVDRSGKPSEDEINPLYRKLLANSLLLPEKGNKKVKVFDELKHTQQLAIQDIDLYISEILYGKKKFINKKWSDRSIFSGTRNVLTSHVPSGKHANDKSMLDMNGAHCGLFQLSKGNPHQLSYGLRNGFLSKVFPAENMDMNLTNIRTRKQAQVSYNYKLFDKFMSGSGITKLLDTYGIRGNRDLELVFGDYYIGLIYDGPDEYMLFQDIDLLPDRLDTKYVRPLTLNDIIYTSMVSLAEDMYALITRYPVLQKGGIYPVKVTLKTTIDSVKKYELDDFGNRTGFIALQYPVIKSGYFDSVSVHATHLGQMGADFDGDTVSLNFLFSKESKKEISALFDKAVYYKNPEGGLLFEEETTYSEIVMKTLTS
jgi:hypothetical protein